MAEYDEFGDKRYFSLERECKQRGLELKYRKCGQCGMPVYGGQEYCLECYQDRRKRGLVLGVCARCGVKVSGQYRLCYRCNSDELVKRAVFGSSEFVPGVGQDKKQA